MNTNLLSLTVGKGLTLDLGGENIKGDIVNHCLIEGNTFALSEFRDTIYNDFITIDKGELNIIRSFKSPAFSLPKALDETNSIIDEIRRRARLFKEIDVTNISSYKIKNEKDMNRIVLLMDFPNFSEFKSVEEDYLNNIEYILRVGRSFGVHLLLLTDSSHSLPPVIASNLKISIKIFENKNGVINYNYNRAKDDIFFFGI